LFIKIYILRQALENCQFQPTQGDLSRGMMTSHGVTSSQPSLSAHHRHVTQAPAGSRLPEDNFRSRYPLAEKMAWFGRRVEERATAGVAHGLMSAVCEAYERWSGTIESERERSRAEESGHDEHRFDYAHSCLIGILDAALQLPANDLTTALSLLPISATRHDGITVNALELHAFILGVRQSLRSYRNQVRNSVNRYSFSLFLRHTRKSKQQENTEKNENLLIIFHIFVFFISLFEGGGYF